jgi:hypothetical protein
MSSRKFKSNYLFNNIERKYSHFLPPIIKCNLGEIFSLAVNLLCSRFKYKVNIDVDSDIY